MFDANKDSKEKAVDLDKKEEPTFQPLTWKEQKALKKAKYSEIERLKKFPDVYVIRNKRTNQMAEIRAASACHACTIIGWKPNKVRVMNILHDADVAIKPETSTLETAAISPSLKA